VFVLSYVYKGPAMGQLLVWRRFRNQQTGGHVEALAWCTMQMDRNGVYVSLWTKGLLIEENT